MPIREFLSGGAFDEIEIRAMSAALKSVCRALAIPDNAQNEKRIIAERIIALARDGVAPAEFHDRVLREARQK